MTPHAAKDIADAWQSGRRIEAIKMLRWENPGMGLVEAKNWFDMNGHTMHLRDVLEATFVKDPWHRFTELRKQLMTCVQEIDQIMKDLASTEARERYEQEVAEEEDRKRREGDRTTEGESGGTRPSR